MLHLKSSSKALSLLRVLLNRELGLEFIYELVDSHLLILILCQTLGYLQVSHGIGVVAFELRKSLCPQEVHPAEVRMSNLDELGEVMHRFSRLTVHQT